MAYIALYRKWRPLVFEDVVEQSYVVRTLKNSIISNRVAHAYLFCGSRGTGKTTMAKIFSKAINCLNPADGDPCNVCEICKGIQSGTNMDVIEIDAASNNGVDNIREIRDEVVYTPAQSKYKAYIIDEVHMLSAGAFNALLKTLEEPPSHVVFILATTEPHKLPATILSRCQRFDFRRISPEGIASRLDKIAISNDCTLTQSGGKLIAKLAEGGMRDAISILDQCISSGGKNVDLDVIMSIVGISGHSFVMEVAGAVINKDPASIFSKTDELFNSGKDAKHFISELILYFRDLLILKLTKDPQSLSYPVYDDVAELNKLVTSLDENHIMAIVKDLSALENSLRWARNPRILLEIGLIKLCEGKFSDALDTLTSRLADIEGKIQNGSFSMSPVSTTPFLSNSAPTNYAATPSKEKKGNVKASPTKNAKKENLNPVTFWNDIINDTKALGRMLIFTNLIDSEAFFSSDNVIAIIPSNAFNKLSLSKIENIEVIQNLVHKRTGTLFHIKIDNTDSATSSSLEEDPGISKAKDIALKGNITLNIIDE